ncbi:MAG: MFS transporter [Myxococcota bacterium]
MSEATDSAPAEPVATQVDETAGLEDVKQLGFVAALTSLGYVFWVVGGMEMIERLAFYGVKAVAALYATEAKSTGGLGITMSEFGTVLMVWAFVQTFLPVFTGGLSDRYGYKESIFVSTVIKITGYLTMAFFPNYTGFFAGALLLATGTAIFKPGIQGTLVKSTTRQNSSLAWGIFYQTVNIGGWMGPILAAKLRQTTWQNVFFACAGIIALNFIMLLIYKEVGKEERLERNRLAKEGKLKRKSLWKESIEEILKPHVFVYLLLFSGFWFMFMALFDVLPVHIRDWVDTTDVVATLTNIGLSGSSAIRFMVGMNEEGTAIQPEGMVNLNAGIIMITCFFFAYLSGKLRATSSMVLGCVLSTCALFMTGYATLGWVSLAAIALFSVGEMMSSPKFSEFIGNFAPSDKKAMYLGFSQIPVGIGWTLEAKIGPWLYEVLASKDAFSRDMLVERGMGAETAAAIPVGEAFTRLVEFTGESASSLTDALYASHNVAWVWNIMGIIGIISAIGIWMYGKWILTLNKPSSQ